MYGYSGKLLRINLTEKIIKKETLDEDFVRNYVGGQGFGAKFLYSENPIGIDSFSPDNRLIFAVGPLEGTNWPGSSRTCITSKSPLTGYLGDTDCGGYWGRNLKLAGYDCLIIEGKSEEPVFINIKDDDVQIRPAKEIWGKSIAEADALMKKENRQGSTMTIGKAGENRVRYACAISDSRYVAGRSGIGAVMGSKNLKGLVVSSDNRNRVSIYDPEGFEKLRKEFFYKLKNDNSLSTLSRFGTWNGTAGSNIMGMLPTKNFQKTTFEKTDQIDGEALEKALLLGQKTCFGCPVACRNVIRLDKDSDEPDVYGGPQYEGVAAMGSLLLIDNPYSIAYLNHLCNHYGLDVISTGVSISFLLECLDNGLITKNDVGFKIKWGDEKGIARMIEAIADRDGMGDLLSEGVKRASEKIGNGSAEFAIHVKGMEVAMHDPRGKQGVGLSYATTHKGADHEESFHDVAFENENVLPELGLKESMKRVDIKGKAMLVKTTQDYWGTMADCLITCKFFMIPPRPFKPQLVVDCLRSITGWNCHLDDFVKIGERVFNLCRLFNLREGMEPSKEDILPKRFSEVLTEGGSRGCYIHKEDFANELHEYYQMRGWDKGIPTQKTLERLKLNSL